MGVIGALRFDPAYLTNTPEGAWPDEEENNFLLFHFDPEKVDVSIASRWAAKPENTASDLDVPWEYVLKDASSYTITLDLNFDDYFRDTHEPYVVPTAVGSGEAPVRNTQESLRVLEAMALPVQIEYLQVYGVEWTSTHTLRNDRYVTESYGGSVTRYDGQRSTWASLRESGAGINPVSVDVAYKLETTRGAKAIQFDQKQILSVIRREPVWHPPRPLRMRLSSEKEWPCYIRDMSVDITAMADEDGRVTAAVAHVKFIPFNGGPTSAKTDDNIGEKNDQRWEQWNTMIASGNYEKRRKNVYEKTSGKILFRR